MSMECEHNTLFKLDPPILNLPEEVLSMIFQAGMGPQPNSQPHFEVVVSHVSHHWREIALENSRLWVNIKCSISYNMDSSERNILSDQLARDRMMERASTYFLRSRSLPITIHIAGLHKDDFNPEFLRLIGDHIGHCLRLLIEQIPQLALPTLFKYLQRQSVPLLEFLGMTRMTGMDVNYIMALGVLDVPGHIFSPGAPRLTTALLGAAHPSLLQCFIRTFASVTSLGLTSIDIGDYGEYNLLRHALMEMKSLNHLELQLDYFTSEYFSPADVPASPIVLRTIQFLHVGAKAGTPFVNNFLKSIHAASLAFLSLECGIIKNPQSLEPQFPSLKSLTLVELPIEDGWELLAMAEQFPDIEHLTCRIDLSYEAVSVVDHVIGVVLRGPNLDDDDHPESKPCPLWLKLHTIAVNASAGLYMGGRQFTENIITLRKLGHPIGKLLLPKMFLHQASRTKVKKMIDLEEFSDDFPTMPMWQDC